jgi:Spy/CpxP family protein refolding chaperone
MGPPPGQRGLALERLSRELGITDTQKAFIDALLADQRKTLSLEAETLRKARQALDAAVLNVPTDDGLIQAEVLQISTLEAQLALGRARTQAKIFQLLNTEQQAKVRQLIAEMEHRGPRRGGRG